MRKFKTTEQQCLKRVGFLFPFFLAVLTASTSFSQVAPATQVLTARNDGWKTATPDSVGVDSKQLLNLTKSVRAWPELGVHAILIERNGRLIYEEYFDGFDERWGVPLGRVTMTAESKHDLRSVTKSVVSTLLGIAHGEGTIRSLDQPLIDWFPDYPELDTPEYRRVTLAHALSMTSGFQWNENVPYNDPRNDEIQMSRNARPLRYALSRRFTFNPGVEFNYNGGLTQVLAAVLERGDQNVARRLCAREAFRAAGDYGC